MKKLNITKVILTAIFWAVGISMVLPLIWMMSTACKVEADVFNFPIQWIPPRWNLVENMKEVWGGCSFSYRLQIWQPRKPYKPLKALTWLECP